VDKGEGRAAAGVEEQAGPDLKKTKELRKPKKSKKGGYDADGLDASSGAEEGGSSEGEESDSEDQDSENSDLGSAGSGDSEQEDPDRKGSEGEAELQQDGHDNGRLAGNCEPASSMVGITSKGTASSDNHMPKDQYVPAVALQSYCPAKSAAGTSPAKCAPTKPQPAMHMQDAAPVRRSERSRRPAVRKA
jgi:hypothetical protein